MNADIKRVLEACHTCKLRGHLNGRVPGLLGHRPDCSKAEEIAVDYCHIRERVVGKVTYSGVLGIIDRATRFARWIPCDKTATTKDIINLILRHWVSIFGFPTVVRSDNEAKFKSDLWARFWAGGGTMISYSAAYHPRANGIIERSFRTMLARIRTLLLDIADCDWYEILPFVEGTHNATPRGAWTIG
jgi:hypothetical protein